MRASVVAHNGRVNNLDQERMRRVQLWDLDQFSRPAPENLLDLHKKDIEHLVNGLQLGNLCGLLHGTKGNVLCAMTGLSTTLHSLTLCVPVSVI